MVTVAVATVVVCLASAVQKITGMGFALVATPALVLLYGPIDGVLLVILTGAMISALMLVQVKARVDWPKTWRIVAAGCVISPLAVWVTRVLPPDWLLILVSVAACLSLIPTGDRGSGAWLTGSRGAFLAGGWSGFLHITSGLSGPPLVAYGLRERWERTSFVLSLQVIFLAFHAVTFAWRGLPALDLATLVWPVVGVIVGKVIGGVLDRRVSARAVRIGMLAIAWAGALTVLARGVMGLL